MFSIKCDECKNKSWAQIVTGVRANHINDLYVIES